MRHRTPRARGQPRRGYRRPKPTAHSDVGRLRSRRAACFLWYFLSLRKKVLPLRGGSPTTRAGVGASSPSFTANFSLCGAYLRAHRGFPPLPALFHSKHVIKLQTCFHTSCNASRPTHKTSQNFLPLSNQKSREPHVFHGTPCFLFYPRFIPARADSAVAHNTVLAPAKPYNDSASHSGRNTPPVRSPDDTCAAAADSSPADAALADIPPTASA